MKIEIDALALENWFDLLAFLFRPRLGQLSSSIGNRRFASIVQIFLHKYVRQVTLRSINVFETANGNTNEHSPARVNLWHSDRWDNEKFPVADWPMPENITNFQSIKLSYLDFSVLRFLQTFQQNSLFTNVHLHINGRDFCTIVQILCHLLPLIASIDSLALEGTDIIEVINSEIGDEIAPGCHRRSVVLVRALPMCGDSTAAEMLMRMMDKARIVEIRTIQYDAQLIRLYRWLNTPSDDRKARVLLLFDGYMNHHSVEGFLERLKKDFLATREAVSYFVGIQSRFLGFPYVPYVRVESLTNSQTNERMTCKMPPRNGPTFVLISRYPLDAAQEWIDASEKEIVEWKIHERSRRIEFGWRCAIGPMEPPRPNLFQKLLSIFH